jgi:hypothetical protein
MSSRRTFAVTVITEAEFVGDVDSGDEQRLLQDLIDEVKRATESISRRNLYGVQVLYCGGGIVAPSE